MNTQMEQDYDNGNYLEIERLYNELSGYQHILVQDPWKAGADSLPTQKITTSCYRENYISDAVEEKDDIATLLGLDMEYDELPYLGLVTMESEANMEQLEDKDFPQLPLLLQLQNPSATWEQSQQNLPDFLMEIFDSQALLDEWLEQGDQCITMAPTRKRQHDTMMGGAQMDFLTTEWLKEGDEYTDTQPIPKMARRQLFPSKLFSDMKERQENPRPSSMQTNVPLESY